MKKMVEFCLRWFDYVMRRLEPRRVDLGRIRGQQRKTIDETTKEYLN